jgi:citrate lyase beta subunit
VIETARQRFASMISLIEVPVLNEKYWAKVPDTAADGIMLDLEDSATPANKERVRERVMEVLGDLDYFGGRTIVVRTNNLATPWGRADLEALAGVDADIVISYPKVETAVELDEVLAILDAAGRRHPLHVMIETARAVIELDRIASHDGVVGLHFGYVDYAADVGSRPFGPDGLISDQNSGYARSKIAIAAAAYGLFVTGGSLVPEFRDLDKVRQAVQAWADLGYTACIAVSPAHLPIINEVMRPSAAEIDRAREVCRVYEETTSRGEPAAVLDGRVITLPDYRVAQLVLQRAG